MIRRKGAFLSSSRRSDLTLSALGLTWSPQCQVSAQKAHEKATETMKRIEKDKGLTGFFSK
jgi:hypothetical protein